ncbi:MAG: diaminopimelate epimerase [Bacillota bacterium]
MKFTKMHGAGNDYIYVNGFEEQIPGPAQLAELAIKLSDRHFGVGGDGLVLILPSEMADFRMQMFNADGSEGRMCGNAIRCVGKYVYDNGMIDVEASATSRGARNSITIETLSGIKSLDLVVEASEVTAAKVNMGAPEFSVETMGVDVTVGGGVASGGAMLAPRIFKLNCVSMGNPHAVVFLTDDEPITDELVLGYGPLIQQAPLFPQGVNVEFAKVESAGVIRMRVYERGSGETLACGTGACAVAVAARELGMTDASVDVILLGGVLRIDYTGGEVVYMTGPAVKVFEGEI